MVRNIAFRIGWALLIAWVSISCSSNVNHQSKGNTPVTTECQGSLKRQDDSAYQAWVTYNRKNDSVGSRKTFEFIKILAEKGCATSQYLIGSELVSDEPKIAMGFLVSASGKGNAAAHFELSRLYYEGYWEGDKKVLKDSVIASSYLSKAASQGYPPALVDLAHKKIREAYLLFQQAADSGDIGGIEFVAKAYRLGIGVQDELFMMYKNEYLYNSIAAKIIAPAGRCREFLELAQEYERGKSKLEIERLREYVQHWFDIHPQVKIQLEDNGECP